MVRETKHTEIGDIPADWEIQTFEETFRILSNNTLSRENFNNRGGAVRNIHYGDILTQFTEVLDCSENEIPYVNDLSLLTASTQLLQDGDIVIADTAEDETVGKVTEVQGIGKDKLVAGLHTIPCRVKKGDFAPGWLGYYMNSNNYHNQIVPFITGIKVSSISKTAIAKTLILIPSLEEQKAISQILSEIDLLISEEQKVINKIKAVKKGCLSKMFPKNGEVVPEMRLLGFASDWEQRKLGDVVDYSNGTGHEEYVLPEGKYELVTLKSINSEGKLVCSEKFVNEEFETLQQGTLIMMLSEQAKGMLGMTTMIPCNNKYVLNQRVAALTLHDYVDGTFLSKAINNKQSYFEQMGAGTKVQNITRGHVENCIIALPVYEEQIKIGDYFLNLDNLITLHQCKLEKYKRIKQGMMSDLLTGKIRLV